MPIETDCPGCARRLRVGEEFAGRQARCPVCSHIYTVPADSTAAVSVGAAAVATAHAAATPAVSDPSSFYGAAIEGFESAYPTTSPSPVEPVNWWLRTPEGVSYGPVTRSAINRWVAEGRVTSDCMVRCADSAWEPADRRYPKLRESPRAGGSTSVTGGASAAPYVGAVYAAPTPQYSAPATNAAARRAHPIQIPHRGATILIMAVLSLTMGCPILSVVAWVMGSADLREIEAGRMDREGLSMTKAGYLIGMIYSMIWIGGALLAMSLILAGFLAGSM